MLLLHTPYMEQVVPWLILAVGFIGVAWINKRGQTGDALQYLQNANKILHEENTALKRERQRFVAEIAALREKTDVAVVINPLRLQIERHEARAEGRYEGLIKVLELIAKQLGDERNNNVV